MELSSVKDRASDFYPVQLLSTDESKVIRKKGRMFVINNSQHRISSTWQKVLLNIGILYSKYCAFKRMIPLCLNTLIYVKTNTNFWIWICFQKKSRNTQFGRYLKNFFRISDSRLKQNFIEKVTHNFFKP